MPALPITSEIGSTQLSSLTVFMSSPLSVAALGQRRRIIIGLRYGLVSARRSAA